MIKRTLKKWLGVDALERENSALKTALGTMEGKIDRRIDELDKLTAMDVDVGVRGPCTIILSGVYRGKGYVQFYEIDHDEFQHMVSDYRDRRKHGVLRNIDAIPQYRGGAFRI